MPFPGRMHQFQPVFGARAEDTFGLSSPSTSLLAIRYWTKAGENELDGGWPESVEEQGLFLLVWRHHITKQYIKDVL